MLCSVPVCLIDSNVYVSTLWNSNNAGVMATPFMLSQDGIEIQFATNHVGMNFVFSMHHLRNSLLLERLADEKLRGFFNSPFCLTPFLFSLLKKPAWFVSFSLAFYMMRNFVILNVYNIHFFVCLCFL